MKINKEGYKIIFVSGLVCLLIWWLFYRLLVSDAATTLLWCSTIFLLLFWFFIVAFFREPRRVRIHDADLVFAPCDGRVVVTEVVRENEYLREEMLQISIFMSITNVHMNWVPVGGEVEYYKYHPGRFLVAWHPKSSTENERTTTVVRMASGQRGQIWAILPTPPSPAPISFHIFGSKFSFFIKSMTILDTQVVALAVVDP